MSIRSMAGLLGVAALAAGLSMPAHAKTEAVGLRVSGVPTEWARMRAHRKPVRRSRGIRNGAGTASTGAPNSTNSSIGPTGQPTGVK